VYLAASLTEVRGLDVELRQLDYGVADDLNLGAGQSLSFVVRLIYIVLEIRIGFGLHLGLPSFIKPPVWSCLGQLSLRLLLRRYGRLLLLLLGSHLIFNFSQGFQLLSLGE